jgi:hypothetical protein
MTTQAGDEDLVKSNGDRGRRITTAVIVAATIVIVVGILACAGTAIVLIYNLPF